ncbi:MAG: TolC family protein [Methylococcaceae bacterium]|nr:TolC family protein [Methylococcaceae bacterium]
MSCNLQWLCALGFALWASCVIGDELMVEHLDPLPYDASLSLKQAVDATFEKYPQGAIIGALQDEAQALNRRSDSLIAGYPMIYLQWVDDRVFNDRGEVAVQTGFQIPVWMWGQRAASRSLAEEAEKSANQFAAALKHEVAGLVRESLWNLVLMENRRGLAQQVYEVSQQLLATVKRRVELGDLALSDQLMAESEVLDKKSQLTLAEAEVMHARKAYMLLTRLDRAPKQFEEPRSKIAEIGEQHPALAAANALIERAQADVEFTRLSKQGNQPTILIGTQHDRATRRESMNNESNLVVQIPFGGEAWNSPYVAQANIQLTQKIADRDSLMRRLEKALHEAEHNLDVGRATLEIANQRKTIAETHLKMSRLAFEAGEIPLIDFLKIQASAQAAIRDAMERAILLQRDTAFYNQVVGVLP